MPWICPDIGILHTRTFNLSEEMLHLMLSSTLLLNVCSTVCGHASQSSNYFRWLNSDGTLVRPEIANGPIDDSCCGTNCNETWDNLEHLSNCKYCSSNSILICEGLGVNKIPTQETLPTSNLSLFKMTNVDLIALPPYSFQGLNIDKLIIEDSNLSFISSEAFAGMKSIRTLQFTNNTINYIHHADYLFEGLNKLSVLSLENNSLHALSSNNSANLHNLQYVSLAGNPITKLSVFFLKDSDLRFLDLREVTFRVKMKEMEDGGLSSLPDTLSTLDLSYAKISSASIHRMLSLLNKKNITTLNLSFIASPKLFSAIQPVRKTLKYLSVEGTDMNDLFYIDEKQIVNNSFSSYYSLEELNMKNCNIISLGKGDIFMLMPNLTTLSLSGNPFLIIDIHLFSNLRGLKYLDLSYNSVIEVQQYTNNSYCSNINSVDFTSVNFDLSYESFINLMKVFSNIEFLSLSRAKINKEHLSAVQTLCKLKFLDLSEIFSNLVSVNNNVYSKLNPVLQNFFKSSLDIFSMASLKTIDLSNNLIRDISQFSFGPALEHLNLSQNLISTWYYSVINTQSNLKSIDLSSNEITYISDAMIKDFHTLHFLNLGSNPLICNNKFIDMVCTNLKNNTQTTTIIKWQPYKCYDVLNNNYRQLLHANDCEEENKEVTTQEHQQATELTLTTSDPNNATNGKKILSFGWSYIIIGFLAISLVCSIAYFKGVDIRFYIHRYYSLKKALILKKSEDCKNILDFHYDVFVSYSDVDRYWVFDHLLPNMESDGDIRLCFHERDFQIGLSILENIIQCMDASQSLLLVVSGGFVRSKWCQFEMHLAQYRLIETLKDQLVLVLLEEIPRKLRPQTLHHLMMTKTYLIWPKDMEKADARKLFWKRLKKALRPNLDIKYESLK